MAEIPVEKKSGKGWLWIILLLILLALLAWWIFDDDGDDVVEYTDNDTVATDTIDDGAMVAGAAAGAMVIGESVNLDNIRVSSLAGDMAFNADVNGQNMLVLFDQERTPGDATEGEYDINPGSMVNIEGRVMSADDPMPEGVVAEIPAGTDRYIFADSIEMVN